MLENFKLKSLKDQHIAEAEEAEKLNKEKPKEKKVVKEKKSK